MPIRFRCQDCRSRVKVPEGSQGKQVRCPRCGRVQTVPKHSQQGPDPVADGQTVHTLVGSIHKAPKRKEALVSAGVGANGNGHDRYALSGGGVPGGLDLSDDGWQTPRPDHRSMSRKERRRLRAEARRLEREQQAHSTGGTQRNMPDQNVVEDSRRRVAELFASSSHKTDKAGAEHPEQPVDKTDSQSATVSESQIQRPEPIAFSPGKPDVVRATDMESTPTEHRAEQINTCADQPEQTSTPPAEHLTLDLTQEPYPFLRVIPWVLRVLALMLIGPAFKAMLVADAQGFSGVVCFLVLLMGLSLVLVTWTVGEIATAVRDIALRKAAG